MSFSFKSSGPRSRPDREKPVVPMPDTPPRYRRDSNSSVESFTSAKSRHEDDADQINESPVKFSPEEEGEMVAASNDLKASANKQYAGKDYSSAISTYDKALAELPNYLDYEMAVLQSNIAACHLQLREWKEAIAAAEKGLDGLEREWPMPKPKKESKQNVDKKSGQKTGEQEQDEKVIELPEDTTEEDAAELLKTLDISDQRKTDIIRIRAKLLLRRAKAKVAICDEPPPVKASTSINASDSGQKSDPRRDPDPTPFSGTSQWSNLSTALDDYSILSRSPYFEQLPTADKKTVFSALQSLPPRIEVAKKMEMDQMLGKLKDLGNMVLKPFGMSTDMFKMTQDPKTGGWSMGFDGSKKS